MPTRTDPLRDGVASSFIQAHSADVIGVLHGFDRLRLAGTLRSLYHPDVMQYYLRRSGVLWKDISKPSPPASPSASVSARWRWPKPSNGL